MIGQVLKVGVPMGVDRPIHVAETALPFQKFFCYFAALDFRRPVDSNQTYALLGQAIEEFKMRLYRMITISVAVNHDGRGTFEDTVVLRPTTGLQDRIAGTLLARR